MQQILHTRTVNGYLIRTTSADHAAIDQTTTRLENRLTAAGFGVNSEVKYSRQQANVNQNRALTMVPVVLGMLIVAISMVGLVSALTGWLLGIPVGYASARLLNWLRGVLINIDFDFTFPPLNVLIALVGTVVLALPLMRNPLRRAVRFKPGEAIRYA